MGCSAVASIERGHCRGRMHVNVPVDDRVNPPLPRPSRPPLLRISRFQSERESGLVRADGSTGVGVGTGTCAARFKATRTRTTQRAIPELIHRFIPVSDLEKLPPPYKDNVRSRSFISNCDI